MPKARLKEISPADIAETVITRLFILSATHIAHHIHTAPCRAERQTVVYAVAAHLSVVSVSVLRVARTELAFVIRDFLFEFGIRVGIFLIMRFHIQRNFQLFFTLVNPVLFIKNIICFYFILFFFATLCVMWQAT